ncbi:MAG: 3'-5' exonuclease [Chitinophagales bacterium]|nr:3'-5' exonuclease [Chitinophagales bacterium]
MSGNYELYFVDVETTGLDFYKHSPIEISLIKLSNNDQKTWCLQPLDLNTIDSDALRINGHKLEDITHKTKFGRETYRDPKKVLIDIENWLLEDNLTSGERWLCGHNVAFDKYMLEFLWKKCGVEDAFPFSRKALDTMQVQLLLDLVNNTYSEAYSLNACLKKFGIKNEKAHSAAADIKATKELFLKQLSLLKK